MATTPRKRSAVIFVAGDPVSRRRLPEIPSQALMIAADAGLVQAEHLGFAIDLVVGDMDSVPAEALERARSLGAEIQRHPAHKDETDLDLAVVEADVGGRAAQGGSKDGSGELIASSESTQRRTQELCEVSKHKVGGNWRPRQDLVER